MKRLYTTDLGYKFYDDFLVIEQNSGNMEYKVLQEHTWFKLAYYAYDNNGYDVFRFYLDPWKMKNIFYVEFPDNRRYKFVQQYRFGVVKVLN